MFSPGSRRTFNFKKIRGEAELPQITVRLAEHFAAKFELWLGSVLGPLVSVHNPKVQYFPTPLYLIQLGSGETVSHLG